MKQKDKDLLLRILCAMLPYGVIVQDRNGIHKLSVGNTEFTDLFTGKCNIKPYLRPMSSMTEEECKELEELITIYDDVDWMLAHHFDFRGLIEKGLALEAPEGMYETK